MASSILTTNEIDFLIQNWKVSKLEDIGSPDWFKERDKLCKLYQVAVLEADTPPSEERVKTSLLAQGKIVDFVKDLITLAVWRLKILPELCKFSPKPEQVIPVYIILYSEQLLVSILETVLFYGELFMDLGDHNIDLIDYAVNQLIVLDTKASFDIDEIPSGDRDTLKVIKDYTTNINCSICVSSISILRYIAENFETGTINTETRIYKTHDLPMIVAHLLDKEVWTVRQGKKVYKFVDNKWKQWLPGDPMLSKVECQTWLLLRQLLLNSTVGAIYSFTNYRKEILSKLIRLLHDNVVDQLSPLADLKLWLHKLSLTAPQENPSNPFIFEIYVSYQDDLLNEYDGKWKEIARKKAGLLLYSQHKDLVDIVKGFAMGIDGMVDVSENLNSCAVCFVKAFKRCSNCRKVWYCSRKCQVDHWNFHKSLCCK